MVKLRDRMVRLRNEMYAVSQQLHKNGFPDKGVEMRGAADILDDWIEAVDKQITASLTSEMGRLA